MLRWKGIWFKIQDVYDDVILIFFFDASPSHSFAQWLDRERLVFAVLHSIGIAGRRHSRRWFCGDGKILAWGDPAAGGNNSKVQEQLQYNIREVQAAKPAFAAILEDGFVVMWGRAECNKYSGVQDQLRSVKEIQAGAQMFAAILSDETAVTWGNPSLEMTTYRSFVALHHLHCVQQIQATPSAFAAIRSDGSVVTWGCPASGGDSSEVHSGHIASICRDLFRWLCRGMGSAFFGGDSSAVQHQLRNVQSIQATQTAFAAICSDKSVVAWGFANSCGDSSAVQHQPRNVQSIQATQTAFAAICSDGSVVAWGSAIFGGDSSAVQHQLRHVQSIQATQRALAAICADGSVVAWGDPVDGGDSSAVQHELTSVHQIQATAKAFAAIRKDGSIVTWGQPKYGADSSAIQDQLAAP